MTKQEVNEIIKATAAKYGFDTEPTIGGIEQPVYNPENYIGFTILPICNWDETKIVDGKVASTVTYISVSSSIRCMGGEPSPDDLTKAAGAIYRGAKLTKELLEMNLKYIETYTK